MKETLFEVLLGCALIIGVFLVIAFIGALVISLFSLFEEGDFKTNFKRKYSRFIDKAASWVF